MRLEPWGTALSLEATKVLGHTDRVKTEKRKMENPSTAYKSPGQRMVSVAEVVSVTPQQEEL